MDTWGILPSVHRRKSFLQWLSTRFSSSNYSCYSKLSAKYCLSTHRGVEKKNYFQISYLHVHVLVYHKILKGEGYEALTLTIYNTFFKLEQKYIFYMMYHMQRHLYLL